MDELELEAERPPTHGVRSSWFIKPIEAERVRILRRDDEEKGQNDASRKRENEDSRRADAPFSIETSHLNSTLLGSKICEVRVDWNGRIRGRRKSNGRREREVAMGPRSKVGVELGRKETTVSIPYVAPTV